MSKMWFDQAITSYYINSVRKSLAVRLDLLVSNLGVKKMDFAKKIHFSQSYVSMVLNGEKTNPSVRFFDAVCREFNVNPEWLKNGKGTMFVKPDSSASPFDAEILVKLRLLPAKEQKTIEEIIDAFLSKESNG